MRRLLPVLILTLCSIMLCACNQATQTKPEMHEYMFWPPAPDVPHLQFLTSISSTADVTQKQDHLSSFLYGEDSVKDLPFKRPFGVRMFEGKLYICDAGEASVAVLDFRKKEVRLLGQSGQMHLIEPIDIAVAPDGVKYIADTGHGAVMVYDGADKYAGRVAVPNLRPIGVAVHGNELYVADLGRQPAPDVPAKSMIRIFNRFDGSQLRTVGRPGSADGLFPGVYGLALDSQGDIYATDVINNGVQKLNPKGELMWGIGGLGDHPGQFVRPKLMSVDADDNLYVVDFAFNNVQLFDKEGHLKTPFGGNGNFPGAMDGPGGICVSDSDLDLFAQYVHPAFAAQRLVFVTNSIGPNKINVYALGELKPGKTVADISNGRVQGIFGFSENQTPDVLQMQPDGVTPPPTPPTTGAARTTAPATTTSKPASRPEARPGEAPF